MYRLHGFSQSGNTYKVALLLQALQQPWTAVHVLLADFAGGLTRSQDWREAHNAMGEVPVLEDGDKMLSQSAAIMVYLAHKHGAFGGKARMSARRSCGGCSSTTTSSPATSRAGGS
jgi:glutathione S-transferase